MTESEFRELITNSLNLTNDELRKLNEALSNTLKWHNEHECLLAAVHTIVCKQGERMEGQFQLLLATSENVGEIRDRLARIESELERLPDIHLAITEGQRLLDEQLGDRLVYVQKTIESQLTALRAEADKGREALDDERKALMNGLLRIDERTRYNVQQIDALRLARAARKKKQERKRGRK